MILDEIISHKRQEVEERKRRRPLADLQARLQDCTPPRGFTRALRQSTQGELRRALAGNAQPLPQSAVPRLIAEIKGRSPSRGSIRENLDPQAIARSYQAAGASCLSVLTDGKYFGGTLERLHRVRECVNLPLLQKDFVIDPYQVTEARVAGADCILLIVAALSSETLNELRSAALQAGLDVLVEAHTRDELETALATGNELVGINNRNLDTFEVSLGTTEELAPLVPHDRVLAGESGILTHDGVMRMAKAGVDAVLIGEALMAADDIGAKAREMGFAAASTRAAAPGQG